ncbi:methionine synthase [Gordonia hydrophobica]|uniref:Methionine synthase n=1 Tax=Gordonia hydrophobica TaxID=40516 RepID=A0ABZ2TZY2_9ACTN|nr:methionine synthase [Gordonia hydrophobica]MBM7369522.1 5-methyltetrahydrofolate--homocysteine methyltransferase [Gordonia hydrophobica]
MASSDSTAHDRYDSTFLQAMSRRVLIGDGAMGTMIQAADLTLDDFRGLEGCNEILNDSRPDVLADIHRQYLDAGADAIETNTFGCNLSNLGDYDIADRIRELAFKGTSIARGVADEFGPSADGTPRFVLGSIGPGTKLPSLGHTTFADIRDAYLDCVLGMLEGGADAILIETSQDLLQLKAAVVAARRAMEQHGRHLPIITHVTVETTGTMLVGSEIGAALAAIEPLGVDVIGLNCATGPTEMSEHLRYLSKHARIPVSVMPNAGLPVLGKNGAEYPLTPEEMAAALSGFVADYGLQFVGGCCGSTPEHIRQVAEAVKQVTPAPRTPEHESEISSLYTAVPFDQDVSFLVIAERTNSNGSKAFREAMIGADYEKCLDIAKAQTRDGAHMLDLNVDYVGRDGAADMTALASRLATASTLPIMIDSTEPEVIRAGLEHLGGRCAVNSVNYEDGDGPDSRFARIMAHVIEHGAAVVALTIDEQGQARTADHKVAIAERLITDLTTTWGLDEEDIIIDALTFPISTGQEEVRRDGIETIEAIRRLKASHPQIHFTLGVSNISFGLNPAARQVLNSVFLHECVQAGLDTAIVHASKILPMARIPDEQRETALDLVYNRRGTEGTTAAAGPDYDPLQKLMELFEGVSAASARESRAAELAALPLFERLERRIVDGDKNGLIDDLDEARKTVPPLDIINETLLSGMKTVGELFGSGQMQLPFVLQSAEVMKASVAHLEQFMEATDAAGKGKIVLATVKGDVHDIGKNLVDIILSNNGYDVVNIGIKQPIATILSAAEDSGADVIGMSGLLVKSTVVMKENLEEMNSRGKTGIPVLLGGAALTRTYVEDDLADIYEGDVRYARDAFEGLTLMDEVMAIKRGEGPDPDSEEAKAAAAKVAERKARRQRSKRIAEKRKAAEVPVEVPARSDVVADNEVPEPPFWGTRIVKGIPVADYLSMLDERALFLGQWGLRGTRGDGGPDYDELVETEGRPRLREWIDRLSTQGILQHAAVVYGFFPAVSEGDVVHVLESPDPASPIRHSFEFPRQQRPRFLCIADFIRSREQALADGKVDVLPFQLATMGTPIADFANKLFAENDYRNYLEVHGIGVQLTEALAEYWHQRIRAELSFTGGVVADEDPDHPQGFFDLEYRGARYSFGYGACPDLADRAKMIDLLEPGRIGVELSEELQLHPEQSTDAFILHHPEAKYFNT